MNSLKRESFGTLSDGIGYTSLRKLRSLLAVVYALPSSFFTDLKSGVAYVESTPISYSSALLIMTSALFWNGKMNLFSPLSTDGQRESVSTAEIPLVL